MLRQVLLINFLFSTSSAMFMLLFMDKLQSHIPLPGWMWVAIAIGLLAFAALLLTTVIPADLRPNLHGVLVKSVVASDILWIALTMLALVIFASRLTVEGVLLVLLVNMVVAMLAYTTHQGRKLAS